jgi:glycosyltransferase involved in cell wall biosynthesis
MNIFQFSFGDGYAGSAKVALVSSKILLNNRHQVHLIASDGSLTLQRAKQEKINVHSFDSHQNFKELIKKIIPLFEQYSPQVVISHHSLDRKVGIALKKKFKGRFVNIGYRHNISETVPLIGSIIYNRYFDFLIACSQGVADSLISSGIKSSKVKVIRNSITIPENLSDISGGNIRGKFGLKDKVVLGMSTWFHKERKGFDILFKAFSKLDDSFVLMIIGIPESDKKIVSSYASEFNIPEQKIIMPGYVENIWEYYKAMDIFLNTSRSEGFSLSLLEAAATQLPIVASDIPGNNEFIINNKNGILFDIRKPDELTDSILRLSEDKSLAERLSAQAYRDVMENYRLKNYENALINFIEQLTSNKV